MRDERTYEVLENYEDLFYLNNHLDWFKQLLILENDEEKRHHLNTCIDICNKKLKGSFYEISQSF